MRWINRAAQQECHLCGRVKLVTPDGRGFPPDIVKRKLVKWCKANGCPSEPKYTAGISLAVKTDQMEDER